MNVLKSDRNSDSAEIRTQACSDFSAFGFWTFRIFGTHTKCLDFILFGFQTVSEIRKFEHVPLASKWLATGPF